MKLRVMMMCLLLWGGACTAYEPGPVSESLGNVRQDGRVFFASSDPYDFSDMGTASPRVVHGDLSLPEGDVRGAVILSHGSGGPGSRQREARDRLRAAGFAVLLMDHFAPRNVGSTARDQIRVTAQMMIADVYAAQRLLATHPAIDADKIGVIGWSKGGITALGASIDRVALRAGRAAPLAFAIAFYPFCGIDLSEENLSNPLLILGGDQDDWTPVAPCVQMVEALSVRGEPAEIEVYPGARHGFDSTAGLFEFGSAITVRDSSPKCVLRIGPDGQTATIDGANSVASIDARVAYLRACGARGVTFEGNAAARANALTRTAAFIEQYM